MHVLAYNPAEVKPGLVAFLIVAALGVATYLLARSMNKQLKKIDFDDEPSSDAEGHEGDGERGDSSERGSARVSGDEGDERSP